MGRCPTFQSMVPLTYLKHALVETFAAVRPLLRLRVWHETFAFRECWIFPIFSPWAPVVSRPPAASQSPASVAVSNSHLGFESCALRQPVCTPQLLRRVCRERPHTGAFLCNERPLENELRHPGEPKLPNFLRAMIVEWSFRVHANQRDRTGSRDHSR
jgi:hypothetical protein